MKVLITGGAGYIGSVLTRMLLDHVALVRVYDNLTWGVDPILANFTCPRFELIKGDICDGESLKRAMQGMDMIIHLAAIVGYPACKQNPEQAQRVNVTGTRILNLARNGQGVIFASTGSNYGAVEDGKCTEDTPLNPLTLYGRTKTEAEKILLDAGNVVAYRFATAFGLSPRLRLDLLPNDFTYQAVRNKSLVIYEASYRRTFIHVRDMARAIIHAMDHFDQMRDAVYNCGDDTLNASKMEIAEMIQQFVPYYIHAAEVGKDADQRNYEVEYARLRATGYRISISLQQGIGEMVRAFQHLAIPNRYSNVGVG